MRRLFSMAGYLAIKEIWHNKGRFLLVSMVIGLITLLVLFIAALGEGLGNGNREYISKVDAELIVYQAKSDFLIGASRLPRNRLDDISRVNGVSDTGRLGTSNASIILPDKPAPLKVALLGVDPGHPGEAIIDRSTALRSGLKIGDNLVIRTTQGTEDKFYDLTVAGIAEGQQYSLQPSIFVPFNTWDKVRPKSEAELNMSNPIANVVLVKLTDPNALEQVRQRITAEVNNVDVATISQAIQALPGYSAQQSTLNTQGGFTLFIGILVIGGFFQIQVLQKVPQIGVLKAIGTSNPVVAWAAIIQIIIITFIGVLIGGLFSYLFSLTFPPTVPIVFNGTTSAAALAALMIIGPLGGLVSIRYAVRIEPLKALGLSS
jgi:putative ABC transport system permease protein